MTRRDFPLAASGLALAGRLAAAPATQRSIVELRYLKMRTNPENQMQRTSDFLRSALPAIKRAGAGPAGFFASVIAEESPFILALATFPSLAAMETARQKEAEDKEYIAARDKYTSQPGLGYERMESSLIRCFEGAPQVDASAPTGQRASRIF